MAAVFVTVAGCSYVLGRATAAPDAGQPINYPKIRQIREKQRQEAEVWVKDWMKRAAVDRQNSEAESRKQLEKVYQQGYSEAMNQSRRAILSLLAPALMVDNAPAFPTVYVYNPSPMMVQSCKIVLNDEGVFGGYVYDAQELKPRAWLIAGSGKFKSRDGARFPSEGFEVVKAVIRCQSNGKALVQEGVIFEK